MIAQQPIDTLPDQKDPTLHLAMLNKGIAGSRDYSAAGDDMTIVGAPVWERVGADFDGAADYLRRAEANWRSGDEQGTIVAWIKRIGANDVIFASSQEASNTSYLTFHVTGGYLKVQQINDDAIDVVQGSTVIGTNRWYQVALVSDGSAYSLYVDGQVETPTVTNGINGGDWFADMTNQSVITIGVLNRLAGSWYPFGGQIKDVRYYSEAKSVDWIKHEYQRGVPDDSLKLWILDGSRDLSRYERSVVRYGGVIVGDDMDFAAAAAYIDCGDVGNIQTISFWVRPETTTEEILQIDAGKHITVAAGTITYTGLTPVATYVNGVAGTALAADLWQHVVCVVSDVDANNLELGREGANYGDIKLKDVRCFDEVKSADWAKDLYLATRGYY